MVTKTITTHGNNSFKPTKRQVNKRLKNTTGLSKRKVNKLRKIEKRQRKKFNRTLKPGFMPGERDMLNGSMSLDRGASMLSRKVNQRTKSIERSMAKVKFL